MGCVVGTAIGRCVYADLEVSAQPSGISAHGSKAQCLDLRGEKIAMKSMMMTQVNSTLRLKVVFPKSQTRK